MNTPKQDDSQGQKGPHRFQDRNDIILPSTENEFKLWKLIDEQKAKIAELEKTITEMQIQHSKGLYTPAHETDRKRLMTINVSLEKRLEVFEKERVKIMRAAEDMEFRLTNRLQNAINVLNFMVGYMNEIEGDSFVTLKIEKVLNQISGFSQKESK